MHKRKLLIPLILLLTNVSVYCQQFYFKILPAYGISVCTQKMPDYLSHEILVAGGSGFRRYGVNLNVNEFSISSGLNIQAAAGYPLNDFISFELRLSAFNNSKKEFEASPPYGIHGKTDWDMKSYSLLPTVLLGRSFDKVSVHIFAWSGLGVAKLNITTSLEEDYREFEFDPQATFSWGYGLEFSYAMTGSLSLFTNIGINNSYYRPEKAHMISSFIQPEYLETNQKEVEYVAEISGLQLWWNDMPDPSKPDIRLKETLISNSLTGGIGIKFTPWK